MTGRVWRALTTAKPMRWVKLAFPPRVRARWLLRILRLTSRSLAGTWRTLVAVGTPRLASMLATMRAAAPRRGTGLSSASSRAAVGPAGWAAAGGAWAGAAGAAGALGAAGGEAAGAVAAAAAAGGAAGVGGRAEPLPEAGASSSRLRESAENS